MREKSQQPRGGGDLPAYKQETVKRKERVKRSNSRGGGGDLSANTVTKSIWWVYNMACLLDVRKIKILANILAGSISRLLLPVDYYCQYILSQCPALKIRDTYSRSNIFLRVRVQHYEIQQSTNCIGFECDTYCMDCRTVGPAFCEFFLCKKSGFGRS